MLTRLGPEIWSVHVDQRRARMKIQDLPTAVPLLSPKSAESDELRQQQNYVPLIKEDINPNAYSAGFGQFLRTILSLISTLNSALTVFLSGTPGSPLLSWRTPDNGGALGAER